MLKPLLLAFLLLAPGIARAADPAGVVSAADRAYDGDRIAYVGLPQRQLETAVDIGRLAGLGGGGGLLGYLIIQATDDRRKIMTGRQNDRAEALAAPIRTSLAGIDVAQLASQTTRTALGAVPWLHVRDVLPINTPAPPATGKGDRPRIVSVDYRYEMSPDFTQLRVIARVSMAGRPGGTGGVAYQRVVTSVGQLRNRSFQPNENADRWNADDGKLAKLALSSGFKAMERLIAYVLSLDQAEASALGGKSRPQAQAAGTYGTLIFRNPADPESLLLWANGPIDVRTLP
jgi:hypothetical protein